MKLETSVKAYFDDIQGMIDEIKRLQTYKLFEGDDMVLVDLDAVVAIMANHIRADKCSESPNGWTPCTPDTMPEEHEWLGTKKFGTTISDEVYVTFENPKGERFCKHLSFQKQKGKRL